MKTAKPLLEQAAITDIPIKIKHKLYDRQRDFHVGVHILSEDLNLYGKIRLAVNPWQRSFQAFQDVQDLNLNIIRFDTQGVEKPELIISQFRIAGMPSGYKQLMDGMNPIDWYYDKTTHNVILNDDSIYNVNFLFQPFIARGDNMALGLVHKVKELLPEGYYMVRLMVLKNLQDTGHLHLDPILTRDDLTEEREQTLNQGMHLDTENLEYITHTDTIIKVGANLVDLDIPLHFTGKQIYDNDIASSFPSRNIISIEIVPVDPSGFVFKEVNGDEIPVCLLNVEKTQWKPFYDHDLENIPHVGIFNIESGVNWNLLQPVKNMNSDEIIDQSEVGRAERKFILNDFTDQSNEAELNSIRRAIDTREGEKMF